MSFGDFKFELRGLARAIGAGEGTSTPRRTAVNLVKVCQEREGRLVAKRNVNDAVVSEGAHGSNVGRLLPATRSAGGDEDTSIPDQVN